MNKARIFSFGKNWAEYVKHHFSDERFMSAKMHLLTFLKLKDLQNKYFLDVGCGSGIHSLAALKCGAQKIVSFDIDSEAVKTTSKLWQISGKSPHWQILEGSILDEQFIKTIEPADVVYS